MRPLVAFLVACVFVSSSARAAAPVHLWSKTFGSSNPDEGFAVAVDAADNIVISGLITSPAKFGGRPLRCDAFMMYLASYTAGGVYRWSNCIVGGPMCRDIAMTGLGEIAATGYCDGPADFGGGTLPPIGSGDVFLVKFDANGVHQWSKRFGSAAVSDAGFGVAFDGAGNVIVVGTFEGSPDFGGGPMPSAAGSSDVFVAKYDANGTHQWSKRFGSAGVDIGMGVITDELGDVIVTGSFSQTVSFGGASLTSAGGEDVFLAKYDANGTHQWSKRFGSTGADGGSDVGVDAAGNVFVAGGFAGTVSFGGAPLASAGGADIFLARYDADGIYQWSRRFGGTADDHCNAIAADWLGDVAMTGIFVFTINFGGGVLTSAGFHDAFMAEFNAAGGHVWSRKAGGNTPTDSGEGVAIDTGGNVIVTGYFSDVADFGAGPDTSLGWDDIFLAKYGQEQPVPVLFNQFTATARGAAVDVIWDLGGDDALLGFTLYRREQGAAQASVVATGEPNVRRYTDLSVEGGNAYEYQLLIRTSDGNAFRSPVVTVTVGTVGTSVGPNYPNPFNPATTIEYTIGARMPVTIEILDVSGSLVARLDQGVREAGTHHAEWDGRDAAGRSVGSGIYFYRLAGAKGAIAGKMTLVK